MCKNLQGSRFDVQGLRWGMDNGLEMGSELFLSNIKRDKAF